MPDGPRRLSIRSRPDRPYNPQTTGPAFIHAAPSRIGCCRWGADPLANPKSGIGSGLALPEPNSLYGRFQVTDSQDPAIAAPQGRVRTWQRS